MNLLLILGIFARVWAQSDDDDDNNAGVAYMLRTSTMTAEQGFYITGAPSIAQLGFAVSSVGDMNGDGFDDIGIGAPYANGNNGLAFAVYGGNDLGSKINLQKNFGVANGLSINGFGGYQIGYAISTAKDSNNINGMLIGSVEYAFFVAGGQSNSSVINLQQTFVGSTFGPKVKQGFGMSVSGAGDLDGDGVGDFVIGAPFDTANGGSAYFNSANNDVNSQITSLATVGSMNGYTVSGAGDINGDTFDDVVTGQPLLSYQSAVNVYLGTSDFYTDVTDIQPAFTIVGIPNDSNLPTGMSLSGAGDVNGDGLDDFIIGSPSAYSGAGAAYVIYGNTSFLQTHLNNHGIQINVLQLGWYGFTIAGVNGNSGCSVGRAGDVNNDGFDDVIIGASGSSQAYVVYGFQKTLPNYVVSLSEYGSNQWFGISGPIDSGFGFSVSGAGDVNADGFDDIVIGAPYDNALSGQTYVIYGARSGFKSFAPTAVPTQAPTNYSLKQVTSTWWFQAIISVVSFFASLITGWILRNKIARRILNVWGHRYVFLGENDDGSELKTHEIGIKLNIKGVLFLIVNGQKCNLSVDQHPHDITKGLQMLLINVLENPALAQNFELLQSEINQLRDYLIANKHLTPVKRCGCLTGFVELGYVRGIVYSMTLSQFGDAHTATYKKQLRKYVSGDIDRQSTAFTATDNRKEQQETSRSTIQMTSMTNNEPITESGEDDEQQSPLHDIHSNDGEEGGSDKV